nr:hypothetical protein [Tanacetum cinerariifolium]
MAVVNDVSQLVDKKGGSYAAIAPKLEPRKFNKWKKQMIFYLAGMESYYIKCIKDGPFQPKIAKDDIMESIISCVSATEIWTDLVHSFEGPSDTKENRIMDLKLEYQTFKSKSTESLSQTYTHYKTLFNELVNDGVNLSKHEINIGFMNNIYRRFVYEDNLIQRRYSDTIKALITNSSSTSISTAFFSNNVILDFQENYDDEVDEKSSEEYLRDLDIEYHERALLENLKRFIKRRNNFSGQKANENTTKEEVSDEEEVTQVKVLIALADDELTTGKNHARHGEWVDITMRKVNILPSMDKDVDWQNYQNHVPEVIAPIEPEIPHTKDTEGPAVLINTKGKHEQSLQNDQMTTQPTNTSSGNSTEGSGVGNYI